VGTVIVAASIVLWVLLKVPAPGTPAPVAGDATSASISMQHSIAATVGRTLEPVTKPIGFDWRINVGLIGAFGARELMVSTLGVIFGIENADDDSSPLVREIRDAKGPQGQKAYSAATALSLLAFFVLACQCTSTVAALRRETKSLKWPAFVLGYTYVLAYLVSFVVYQGSLLLGLG
jgi:ferrous iron transport protein B